MKLIFNFRIFTTFLTIIFLLFAIIGVVFYNLKFSSDNTKRLAQKEDILNLQDKKFQSFLKTYDEKLLFIDKLVTKLGVTDLSKDLISDIVFQDSNIIRFKIVGADSKEKLYIANYENTSKIKLKSLFLEESFKDLRTLPQKRIYRYFNIKDNNTYINFAIKSNNEFHILKIDLQDILKDIENSNIVIKDEEGNFFNNFNLDNFFQDEYMSRKLYFEEDKYFTIFIETKDFKNSFIENNYKSIIILAFIAVIFLSIIFTIYIAKEREKIKFENQKLNLDGEKKDIALSKNEQIMNKYIMFIQINEFGIIRSISQTACNFLGFSSIELIGKSYQEFIYKDLIKTLKRLSLKFEKRDTYHIQNLKGKKKNLDSFWIDIFIQKSVEEGRTVYNIVFQDVTDRKTANKLYKKINAKIEEYSIIFNNVESGLALLTLDGKFVDINDRMSKLLGYSEEDFLKMSIYDIIENSSKIMIRHMIHSMENLREVSRLEYIFKKKDESFVHLELSLILMLKKQRIIFVVNSLEDKRKLQELNSNLEKRIEEEIEKSRLKDQVHYQEQLKSAKLSHIGMLAAGITHEINTPLTYIKGNLELMQYDIEDLPASDIKDRMLVDSKKMKDGIGRIANIIESMREMSQSNSEKKGYYNIYATVITALTISYNKSKNISRVYLNDELFDLNNINKDKFEFCSNVQRQRIEQVWIVIINNALDELVKIEDYEKRELRIEIEEDGNEIVLKFKDNAKGLSKEMLKKLFEPFSSTKEHGGMGIGLSIAKKIIDEHDGEIKAYNEIGAVFEVRLKKCVKES